MESDVKEHSHIFETQFRVLCQTAQQIEQCCEFFSKCSTPTAREAKDNMMQFEKLIGEGRTTSLHYICSKQFEDMMY